MAVWLKKRRLSVFGFLQQSHCPSPENLTVRLPPLPLPRPLPSAWPKCTLHCGGVLIFTVDPALSPYLAALEVHAPHQFLKE
jgi:hypothetical protein